MPGKFEGEPAITEILYEIAIDSGADNEIAGPLGWYAKFIQNETVPITGWPEGVEAIILWESSQTGFVTARMFETLGACQKDWDTLPEWKEKW